MICFPKKRKENGPRLLEQRPTMLVLWKRDANTYLQCYPGRITRAKPAFSMLAVVKTHSKFPSKVSKASI